MKAREFEKKAKELVRSARHFKLYTDIGFYDGHDVCEIQLWMTDPWGQDNLVLTISSNGDDSTDLFVLSELKERLKLCREYMRTHYDYERGIAIQTA